MSPLPTHVRWAGRSYDRSDQVRSAMPDSATSCARSRRRKARPSRPTSSAASWRGQRRHREVVGPGGAVGDHRRRRGARTNAPSTDASWVTSPADASTAPSTSSALQSARNSARVCRRASGAAARRCSTRTGSSPTRARRGADRGSGRSCAPPRRCAPSTSSISRTSRSSAIDSRSTHRELVDRDVVAAFEHVDADDVAVDRADPRRDQPERTGPVGEPHPHQDVGDGLGGVAHGSDATGHDDANVSPR